MKYLFITPINEHYNLIPLIGIPSLISILENSGVECEHINLNAEFNKTLLHSNLKDYFNKLQSFYEQEEYNKLDFIDKSIFAKRKSKILIKIKKFNKYYKKIKPISSSKMYNYILFNYFSNFITKIKEENPLFLLGALYENKNDYEINTNFITSIFNISINNFKDFYNKKADEIINKNPNIVGIQILTPVELASALFLAYILKQKKPNIHINIGGSFFELTYKKITNLKDLFNNFFDSITIGEATQTVLDTVDYINHKKSIEEITNFLYIKDGEVKYNGCKKYNNLNQLPFQSFTGYKKEDYLLPELILPVRASLPSGCYWRKCIYCTCSDSKDPYRLMSVKRFTDEIEYLSKKYNTKYFAFWDNAFHPKYIEKVADILIKKNLKIKYTMYARLEKEFSYNLLKKLKKSGCVEIFWGLDTASNKMLKYINKGIDLCITKDIIKNSHKAGIFNYIYIILGYPTETIDDLNETFNFIKDNSSYIDYVDIGSEVLYIEGSIMNNNKSYYKNLTDTSEEFIKTKKKIETDIKIMKKFSYQPIYCQWNFLYIAKYGIWKFKFVNSILYYYRSCRNKFLKKLFNLYFNFIIRLFVR